MHQGSRFSSMIAIGPFTCQVTAAYGPVADQWVFPIILTFMSVDNNSGLDVSVMTIDTGYDAWLLILIFRATRYVRHHDFVHVIGLFFGDREDNSFGDWSEKSECENKPRFTYFTRWYVRALLGDFLLLRLSLLFNRYSVLRVSSQWGLHNY